MQRIVVNLSDLEQLRASRLEAVGMGLDQKRPKAWLEYGYPETVEFDRLYAAYERGGAGHGAVHRLLDKCWQDVPRIKAPKDDKESPWETGVNKVLKGIKAWQKLRDFDRRNMVGRFAGLIYRVADGQTVDQPLGRGKLVDIIPVFESQLKVTRWDSDLNSETYGQPLMWQYRARVPEKWTDRQGQPEDWKDVHPSRVQILAEGSVGGQFFDGVPLLLAGFNNLIDLEKIAGGSGESYLKNSQRNIVFEFEKDVSASVITNNPDGTQSTKNLSEVLQEKTRAMNRSIDASMAISGGEAKTLQTAMADPTGAFQLAANLFAASVQLPFTILFGQQTGRLASDEDQKDYNARGSSRRENELTPMLEEFVKRMQACGALEQGEFEIEWQPLDAPDDDAKAGLLVKLTSALKQAFDAGINEPLLDRNELRRVVGFEERPAEDEFREDQPPDPQTAPMPSSAPRPALKAA